MSLIFQVPMTSSVHLKQSPRRKYGDTCKTAVEGIPQNSRFPPSLCYFTHRPLPSLSDFPLRQPQLSLQTCLPLASDGVMRCQRGLCMPDDHYRTLHFKSPLVLSGLWRFPWPTLDLSMTHFTLFKTLLPAHISLLKLTSQKNY